MDEILKSQGLAGLVIAALAGVVVYLSKKQDALQNRYNDMQESRLQDARDTRDKLAEPMEALARQSEKIYEFLLSSRRGN